MKEIYAMSPLLQEQTECDRENIVLAKEFAPYSLECNLSPYDDPGMANWKCLICQDQWKEEIVDVRRRASNRRQCLNCRRNRVSLLETAPKGVRSGHLTIESVEGKNCTALCVCGKMVIVPKERFKRGDIQSCGCLKDTSQAIGYGTGNLIDLTGLRVGRLVVIHREGLKRRQNSTDPNWRCLCDCGREALVSGQSLRLKSVLSCGCLRKIVIYGIPFQSWIEAAIYLNLKKQGKRFFHNLPYNCKSLLRNMRYDFYIPDEDTFIEVTGYNKSVKWWFKYLRKIVRKKHYVEDILHQKFVFINRLCTKEEREELIELASKR